MFAKQGMFAFCAILPCEQISMILFANQQVSGGEAGIRTLGTRKGTTVFETAPFDRSGTSPSLTMRWLELDARRNLAQAIPARKCAFQLFAKPLAGAGAKDRFLPLT